MTLVTRAQWGARPPAGSINTISAHPLGVAVHYEGVNVGTTTHDTCAQRVRNIQADHMRATARHDAWSDIAYSFLACQHGYLFAGRGTGKGSAANGTTTGNQNYYAVCGLIGPTDTPTQWLITAIGDGINLCRAAGAGDVVVGHLDLFATACPGAALYTLVRAGHWNGFVTPAPTPVKPAPVPVVGPKPVTRVLLVVDGVFGVLSRKRFQQWAGLLAQDGVLGPLSWRAIQRKVGGLGIDGLPGPITWKAIQRKVGSPADGLPGPDTYRHLQAWLNSH